MKRAELPQDIRNKNGVQTYNRMWYAIYKDNVAIFSSRSEARKGLALMKSGVVPADPKPKVPAPNKEKDHPDVYDRGGRLTIDGVLVK